MSHRTLRRAARRLDAQDRLTVREARAPQVETQELEPVGFTEGREQSLYHSTDELRWFSCTVLGQTAHAFSSAPRCRNPKCVKNTVSS